MYNSARLPRAFFYRATDYSHVGGKLRELKMKDFGFCGFKPMRYIYIYRNDVQFHYGVCVKEQILIHYSVRSSL